MDLRDLIRENQAEAMKLLQKQGFTEHEVLQLWGRIKADYFARYNPKANRLALRTYFASQRPQRAFGPGG